MINTGNKHIKTELLLDKPLYVSMRFNPYQYVSL